MGRLANSAARRRTLGSLSLIVGVLAWGATATGAAMAAPQGPWQVVRSDAQGLRLELGDLRPSWREVPPRAGTAARYDLDLPGFVSAGSPGAPRLPRAGAWVLVPPGMRPELVRVREDWRSAEGRPLTLEPVPAVIDGAAGEPGTAVEMMLLPGEALPAGVRLAEGVRADLERAARARSGGALELGEVSWWRGRRIVPLQLVPVRHDAEGRALEVLTAGTWEIRFVADPALAGKAAPRAVKTTPAGDRRLGASFLNRDLLEVLPTEAAAAGALPPVGRRSADKTGTLLADEVRLAVRETKLLRVTAERLRSRGLLPAGGIDEDQIRLYQRRYLERLDTGEGAPYAEIEVPILMVGEGDAFDGDDYFLFYGLRLRDDVAFTADLGTGPETVPGAGDPYELNNEANWYWLAASEPEPGRSWARMPEETLPAAAGTPLPSYRRSERHEEQAAFRENPPRTGDDRLYANHYTEAAVSVDFNPLWSPAPDGADADLQVTLAGFNFYTRNLRLDFVLEDGSPTLLQLLSLSSPYQTTLNYTLPAAALAGDRGEVVLSIADASSRLYAFLNAVTLSYDALYRALGDRLEFDLGSGSGARPVQVTGFSNADIGLVDITDPRRPIHCPLGAQNVVADGGTWTLSIAPQQDGIVRRFAAQGGWSAGQVPEWTYFLSELVSDPVDPTVLTGAAPDLIVITVPEFGPALQPWLEHRRRRAGGDLEVLVVQAQDLYDVFSGGLKDPWAIKRFAKFAIDHWGTWALQLVGDANENVRGVGVPSSAQGWAEDFVPTHYHVQTTGIAEPELMASDKWYATDDEGMDPLDDDFPDNVRNPWTLLVGRFPCNSAEQLTAMIDKVITVETPQPGQAWRRRAVFAADDAWSNGYGAEALTVFEYNVSEEWFARSERDSLAPLWRDGTPIALEADTLFLAGWLDPLWPAGISQPRPTALFRDYAETYATPPLLGALSQGALVAHYQGHANESVLSSEYWLQDIGDDFHRQDVATLNNGGKPWVFFGMGCHISDWAQNVVAGSSVTPNEMSLSEKMLLRGGAGAVAAFGSSGFEYITHNRVFGEYIFRRWTLAPPVTAGAGPLGEPRSRWVLGELMWSAEADLMALYAGASLYREMVSQYALLGDALMVLDGGEPEVAASLDGVPLPAGQTRVDVQGLDETNRRTLVITARDEAGIAGLVVVDDHGGDLSSLVTETLPAGAVSQQEVTYTIDLPVRPFDHRITLSLYDTGAPLAADRHWELVLDMPQEVEFTVAGQPHDPAQFEFNPDEPVRFDGLVSSAAWLHAGMTMGLSSDNLVISDPVFDLAKSNQMSLAFTATATGGTGGERSVDLTIDGYATTWVLQAGEQTLPTPRITQIYNFPNPMRDETRFLFRTAVSSGRGAVRVFSTSGRTVASVPFTFGGGGVGVVPWHGLDPQGGQLANGTYLYRIEMNTPAGRIVSEVQRLVVMR